ncbi:hypothetical protein LTR37_014786 [Vermiconidia calcicola]|uniref:Uncharacterized protein n=1 Tax=Vermiconidia calcicola TaxID=1690605 RepID=A0ACC3MTU3_9PEZI|nr:hypothetical protein LTR37_014786 [Vermiconidia calcicola]
MAAVAACPAVFETYELLEDIISRLPAQDILANKRVSKAWLHIIRNSKKIRIAAVFMPTEHQVLIEWPHGPPMFATDVLVCTEGTELKANSVIHEAYFADHEYYLSFNDSTHVHEIYFQPGVQEWPGLEPFAAEFATYPPCRAITVNMDLPSEAVAVVYRQDGVKIGDLVEVGKVLDRQEREEYPDGYYGNKTCWPYMSVRNIIDQDFVDDL